METEIRVEMEAWRFIRRACEDDLKSGTDCPSAFEVGRMLETGKPPTGYPMANLPTSAWWPLIERLRAQSIRHKHDLVGVIMSTRTDEAVALSPMGEINRSLFPGRVRLPQ